ncbi:5'-3' exonuclease [Caulobacter phage Seuss]|uniref:5'-3' exonuclease n=1 Tax=Caulobacter phage Seuss TaxID=1675601 RepID=A0A0K1LM68_9CAUD|nr:5'-3' exonuclease [Caulobacter phage Seuss]AKU43596.1 5'-3' exonuclease [Caulobacter phage Seuss]
MRLVIVDANSWVRVKMESERPQDFIRGILNLTGTNALIFRVWVWDGYKGNDARRALFPRYKSRPPSNPDIMKNLNFVRELIGLTNSWQVQIPGFEGDDVVAALTKHFVDTTDYPITIAARDGDLAALRCLAPTRITCEYTGKIQHDLVRLYKAYVGDQSDTIPGLKGFGDGAWEKADKVALQKILDAVRADPSQPVNEEQCLAAGISKASVTWLSSQENRTEWAIMARIIEPLPIPHDVLHGHLKQGTDDPAALMEMMKRYML